MYVTIAVSQKDIDWALQEIRDQQPVRGWDLPLINAVRRVLGLQREDVVIEDDEFLVSNWGAYPKMVGKIPKKAQDAARNFKHTGAMMYFTFRLDLKILS